MSEVDAGMNPVGIHGSPEQRRQQRSLSGQSTASSRWTTVGVHKFLRHRRTSKSPESCRQNPGTNRHTRHAAWRSGSEAHSNRPDNCHGNSGNVPEDVRCLKQTHGHAQPASVLATQQRTATGTSPVEAHRAELAEGQTLGSDDFEEGLMEGSTGAMTERIGSNSHANPFKILGTVRNHDPGMHTVQDRS